MIFEKCPPPHAFCNAGKSSNLTQVSIRIVEYFQEKTLKFFYFQVFIYFENLRLELGRIFRSYPLQYGFLGYILHLFEI